MTWLTLNFDFALKCLQQHLHMEASPSLIAYNDSRQTALILAIAPGVYTTISYLLHFVLPHRYTCLKFSNLCYTCLIIGNLSYTCLILGNL